MANNKRVASPKDSNTGLKRSTRTYKLHGELGKGFGFEAGLDNGIWVINKVIPNSPSSGKLYVGDRIIALDGISVENASQDDFEDILFDCVSLSVKIHRFQ